MLLLRWYCYNSSLLCGYRYFVYVASLSAQSPPSASRLWPADGSTKHESHDDNEDEYEVNDVSAARPGLSVARLNLDVAGVDVFGTSSPSSSPWPLSRSVFAFYTCWCRLCWWYCCRCHRCCCYCAVTLFACCACDVPTIWLASVRVCVSTAAAAAAAIAGW